MSFNPFPVGTQLHVETCFGDKLTGEVVTYENSVKMLILRCPSTDKNGKISQSQCIVNLDYCKDLSIITEAKQPLEQAHEPPARLNVRRLDQRLKQSLVQRESLLRCHNAYATPRGKQLFKQLSKHFGQQEIWWQQDKIVVLRHLTIKPPYCVWDIRGAQKSPKLLKYVQRLVEKFNETAARDDNGHDLQVKQ